jgi:hypothetical protein
MQTDEASFQQSGQWKGISLRDRLGRVLYMQNLPFSVGVAEIDGFFRGLKFADQPARSIRICRFPVSNDPDGTALVEFATELEANRAFLEKSNQFLNGRKIGLKLFY